MASSSSADPSSDTGNDSSRHAWSQIVRCKDATPLTTKPSQSANADRIQTPAKESLTNRVRDHVQMMAKNGIIVSESTVGNTIVSAMDARVFDETSDRGEEIVEAFKTAIGGNAVAADMSVVSQDKSPGTNYGDASDVRVSRPPWRKPVVATEGEMNPQPVMGATSWPALAEARNMKKNSENRKSKSYPLNDSQVAASYNSIQESFSEVLVLSGDGSTHRQALNNKPSFKGAPVGIGRPAFQPIENGALFSEHPTFGAHGPSEHPLKHSTHSRMKGNFSANSAMDTDRIYHHRNDGAGPFHNSNRKWRNNHRDQGRGWHHHGRTYENAGDMAQLLHEQRIGPRNMPRPQPFVNMNPGFYSMPYFQNNGMCFIPPGAPEFVHGPPYYPVAPPIGVMAPEPFSLQSKLINQVDYYFSVENLCRDVFLRTHMDEEGFVPVSVIAKFNRIQKLSNNPLEILEALQHSAVVEVQHDKIRRRNDRGKWRLMRDQVYGVNSAQKNASMGDASQGESNRYHDGRLVSLNDTKSSSAMERAGAEHESSSCDRLISFDDCKEIKDKPEIQNVDDVNSADTNVSTHLFCRDGSKEENAVCSVLGDDSARCQSFDSTVLQEEALCNHRTLVAANQEFCSSEPKFSDGHARVSQATLDGKPVCWSGSEGFWVESSPYRMQGGLEQNNVQARESNFMLKFNKAVGDHSEEGSDGKVDRPIKVSHTSLGSLGSYIAVP